MSLSLLILFGLLGLAVGSFLSVCVHRLPRGESIVWPASHCPACGHALAPWENVPLLSFLVLRGRCRACAESISWRYPALEGATALLFVLAAQRFGLVPELGFALLGISVLMAVAFIDLEHLIIPNRIVLPATALLLVLAAAMGWERLSQAGLGLVLGFSVPFLLFVLRPGALGAGDVKLGAFLGALLGSMVLLALFLGVVVGGVAGAALLALGARGRKDVMPFGPFLALGGLVTLLAGPELWAWYLAAGVYQ